MSMAEMSVVLTGLLLPGVIVLAIVLFALYWVVRKAVRDEIKSASCSDANQKMSRSPSGE